MVLTTIPTPSAPIPTIQAPQAPHLADLLHLHTDLPAGPEAGWGAPRHLRAAHGQGVTHEPKRQARRCLAAWLARTGAGAGSAPSPAILAATAAPQPLATAVARAAAHR